jgi:hypothetical protein
MSNVQRVVLTMTASENEDKEYRNMIVACGRSPGDFVITTTKMSDGNTQVTIENRRLGRKKDYIKDGSTGWIIQFATDLKLGEM